MRLARAAILARGGADAVNSLTRYFLALLGQISYDHCSAVLPEILLLPKWLRLGVHAIGGSRTTMVPLSIIAARRPVRRLEPRLGIRELFLREPADWPAPRCPGRPAGTAPSGWQGASRVLDRLAKWCQRRRLLPWRRKALAAAEQWMLSRFDQSDGLGATHASIVWSMVALKVSGLSGQQRRGSVLSAAVAGSGAGRRSLGHDKNPAVQVARGRYGDGDPGLGGQRAGARSCGAPAGHRVVAGAANHAAWRLGGERRCRAGWMVSAICQRLLPRLQRYGGGADGAEDAVCRRRQIPRPCRPSCGWPRSVARRAGPWRNRVGTGGEAAIDGASAGSWPCKIATADGPHSIGTTGRAFLR